MQSGNNPKASPEATKRGLGACYLLLLAELAERRSQAGESKSIPGANDGDQHKKS